MKKALISILAADFVDNDYLNIKPGLDGCPIQRGFIRAGILPADGKIHYMKIVNINEPINNKVISMFSGNIPVEDFTMQVKYADNL